MLAQVQRDSHDVSAVAGHAPATRARDLGDQSVEDRRSNATSASIRGISRVFRIVTERCQRSSRRNCMLMKPENRTRITAQVVPWVAAEAVLVTHGTSSPRRARSDPRPVTRQCADRIGNSVLAGPGGRIGPSRDPASPTAVGREPPPEAAVRSVRPSARGSRARPWPR